MTSIEMDKRQLPPFPFRKQQKWIAMTIVTIGTFVATIAMTVVHIGLPAITSAFRTDIGISQWVVIGYLFTTSSLLLNFGKIGDLFGRSKIYSIGLVIFSLASGLCGLSPSVHHLIAFRVLQGIGGAMIIGGSTGLIVENFPPNERGTAVGLYVSMVGASLTIGPSFGGFLIHFFGWRSIFLVNVPLGIAAIILAILFLAPSEKAKEARIDFLGGAMLALFLLCFLLFLHFGQKQNWTSPFVLLFLSAFFLFFSLFVIVELKSPHPMLDLKIFRNRIFTAAQASNFLNHLAVFSMMFIMPFYLVDMMHFSEAEAGLIITPATLGMILVSPLSGWISDRIGTGIMSVVGFALICAGLFSLSTLTMDSTALGIVIRFSILGVGRGIFSSPNSSAIMGSVNKDQYGVAGAMTANLRHLGYVSGVALVGTLFAQKKAAYLSQFVTGAGIPLSMAGERAFMMAFRDVLLFASFLSILGIATSAIRAKSQKR